MLHALAVHTRIGRPYKRLLALVLSTITFAPTALIAQAQRHRLETAEIVEKAMPATATIVAIGRSGDTISQGSGFVIRSDGVVVTNFHVLRGATGAVVVMSSGERFTRVRVLDADSTLDLALLKVPGAGMAVLPTRTTTPKPGERAVAIGSPLGLARTVTEGIVSATRIVAGRELVQISAAISPGSSGGAVLDGSGNVFAVSTSYLKAGQSLNFAVPVRYALGILGDSPRETSIAELFGGIQRRTADEEPAPERSVSVASDPAVTRNPNPHASVDGTYSVSIVWRDAKDESMPGQFGYLFATEHVGYLAIATRYSSDERGPTHIYNVRRWRTNGAGDLILVAGGVTFDGFQTADDGFLAFGTLNEGSDSLRKLTIGGVPERLRLSRNDGLYSVASRSRYLTNGHETGDPVDWDGEAAVAFANDSIYVDLFLSNSRGGTTGFFANGPLINGNRFELSGGDGTSLKGEIRDGRFWGEFFDKREKGAFRHTLQADRR